MLILSLLLNLSQAQAESPESVACMASATDQLSLNTCASDEYARQDKRLNDNYAVAMAKRDQAAKAALRDAQRVWAKERDAACPDAVPGSGSAAPMDWNLCRAAKTEARADELGRM